MVPGHPRQATVDGVVAGGGVEVVAGGDHGGVGAAVGGHEYQVVDHVAATVALPHAGDPGAVGAHVAIGVADAGVCGDRAQTAAGVHPPQPLVVEVREVHAVARHTERPAPVLVNGGAGRAGSGQDVDGVVARRPPHDHLAAALRRAALVPVEGALGDLQPAEGHGLLDQRCGGDWRRPRAVGEYPHHYALAGVA